jgi:hypothetical protein
MVGLKASISFKEASIDRKGSRTYYLVVVVVVALGSFS